MKLTYGAEFEWADWDTRTPIPPELGWIDKDEVSICNSDGTAFWHSHIGGEVCLAPTNSIDEAVSLMANLRDNYATGATVNYRCGVHVHLSYDGLAQDLEAQKAVLQYSLDNQLYVNSHIYVVDKNLHDSPAWRKYARGLYQWGQTVPEPNRVGEMMTAQTPEEFYRGHYAPNRAGTRNYGITPRAYVNLRSLKKHGTIEFRNFYGTTDEHEFRSMLEYSETFLSFALGDQTPVCKWFPKEYILRGWDLPFMKPWSEAMEAKYQETRRR